MYLTLAETSLRHAKQRNALVGSYSHNNTAIHYVHKVICHLTTSKNPPQRSVPFLHSPLSAPLHAMQERLLLSQGVARKAEQDRKPWMEITVPVGAKEFPISGQTEEGRAGEEGRGRERERESLEGSSKLIENKTRLCERAEEDLAMVNCLGVRGGDKRAV